MSWVCISESVTSFILRLANPSDLSQAQPPRNQGLMPKYPLFWAYQEKLDLRDNISWLSNPVSTVSLTYPTGQQLPISHILIYYTIIITNISFMPSLPILSYLRTGRTMVCFSGTAYLWCNGVRYKIEGLKCQAKVCEYYPRKKTKATDRFGVIKGNYFGVI